MHIGSHVATHHQWADHDNLASDANITIYCSQSPKLTHNLVPELLTAVPKF